MRRIEGKDAIQYHDIPLALRARDRSSPRQACAQAALEPASRLQRLRERKSSSPSDRTYAKRFGTAACISVVVHCAYCEENDAPDSTPLKRQPAGDAQDTKSQAAWKDSLHCTHWCLVMTVAGRHVLRLRIESGHMW